LRVEDSSHPGEARRLAAQLSRALGFDEARSGQVALVVTELATNLVKHTAGAGGELVFSPMIDGAAVGLDILSLDQGPGIVNIAESLRDGHSTAGSLGTGLGAIRRQSALFDIFSAPGHGTALFSRLWQASPAAATSAMLVGGVCLPVRGEQACGDAWAMKNGPGTTLFLLADGLGHGPDAAAAANLAVEIFEKTPTSGPEALLHLIDVGLRGTRGAAVVVAEVDHNQGVVRFAGVGNLVALIVSAGVPHNLISHYGTAGVETPKIQAFTLPLPDDGLFILHSDGIATRWSLDEYPGLSRKHPALIAGVLYRDHQRLRDDSTVVVARSAIARPAA
jgi:anti-sigma regulatory factor (Ser/Thr protein kinase)/serine/threonine protein phosphatase PrpC